MDHQRPVDDRPRRITAALLGALAAVSLAAACGGPPIPSFVSPAEGEVPRAPDVLVEVVAEGAPEGSDLSLFVGAVKVDSQPGQDRIQYVWDTTSLSGEVTLWAEVTTPSGRRAQATRDVTVASSGDVPPAVAFVWPLDGQSVAGMGLVEVQATGDRAAEVEAVRLQLDGALLYEDEAPEFIYSWDTTTVADGRYVLQAIGRYGSSYTATAEAVVYVDNTAGSGGPVTVSITSPSGDVSGLLGEVTVKAAIEHENDLQVVEFFIDDVLMHSTNGSTYQWVWNTLDTAPGAHTITVGAQDIVGNYGSDSLDVVAGEPGDLSIAITQPVEGENISGDYQVLCSLVFSEDVQQVDFYLDDVLARSTTNPPWQWAWGVTAALGAGTLLPGEHTIRAVVLDAVGGEASDEVTITISDPG